MLLLTNATTMAIPQLFRRAIDDIKHGADIGDLRWVAGPWLVAVALAGMVFRTLSRLHILYAARDVELDSALRLLRPSYASLEPGFFETHPTGDLMSRTTNDLTQVRLMLGPGVLNTVNTIIAYATALPLMVAISWKLTLITFAVYPPAMMLMRRQGRRLYTRNRAAQEALGRLSNCVQENLNGAQLVRAFAVEPEQERRFNQVNQAYFQANVGLLWTRSGMFRLSMSLATMGTLATVYFGAQDVLAGRLSLGDVTALVEYMALLSWPTFAMGWVLSLWQRGSASMARLEEILLVAPQIVSGARASQRLEPSLEVRGLSVTQGGHVAVRDIHFKVPAGKTLGIVGPIGGGKSVLVRSLLRLVSVPPSSVFIDGVDSLHLPLNDLRRMFGYVQQNPSLFSKSIADNVAFGAPDSPKSAIEAALEAAALSVDLTTLPDGLDTMVGERGLTLSGGQKQRTAIARAWVIDPPILILDDALSAVDFETERKILQNLHRNRHGRTTLVVAHRLSAVTHADEIIVLDKGEIVERGTHAELVAQAGLYAAMARHQALSQAVAGEAP